MPTPFVLTAPDPADLQVAQFIFDRHTPPLGTLTQQFQRELAAGQYNDFTRRDVDGAGTADVLVGLPLASLQYPIAWPDPTRRFQVYRWDTTTGEFTLGEIRTTPIQDIA